MTETEGKIMKKILIATTALVATAGVAAADVTFGGFGRMGLSYTENSDGRPDTIVDHRVRLIIDGSATADNGMSFNAQTRIQWDDVPAGANDSAGANNGALRGAAFTMTSGDFTVNLGNSSLAEAAGATYWMGGLGYTGFVFANPRAANGDVTTGNWAGADDTEIAVRYSNSGMTFGVGTSDDANGVNRNVFTLNYALGDVALGLTHQASDAANNAFDYTALSLSTDLAGASVSFYADDYADGTSAFGAAATWSLGGGQTVRVMANTLDDNNAATDNETYGIHYGINLGGGVSFSAGAANIQGVNNAEAGIVFNF
jgi:outer membrane protein OmpU